MLKLKTGIDPRAEIVMIKAVREAVGPKVGLKLDANQGWTLKEALKVLGPWKPARSKWWSSPSRSGT